MLYIAKKNKKKQFSRGFFNISLFTLNKNVYIDKKFKGEILLIMPNKLVVNKALMNYS